MARLVQRNYRLLGTPSVDVYVCLDSSYWVLDGDFDWELAIIVLLGHAAGFRSLLNVGDTTTISTVRLDAYTSSVFEAGPDLDRHDMSSIITLI
jgi:hypothetical protein